MADMASIKNPAAILTPVPAGYSTATAGGSGDNTAVTGVSVDRSASNLPYSAMLCLRYRATFGAAAATLSLASIKIQDSADNSTWTDFTTGATAITDPGVVATAAGSGTVDGVAKINVSLRGARQYIRAVYTPDLSAANTDTLILDALFIFSGEDRHPAV